MGHVQIKESSSAIVSTKHQNNNAVENNQDRKREQKKRKPSLSNDNESKEEKVKFGEQLQDDLINSFCDKLQAACPQKLEALLAIQSLMISDMEDVRRHVTGKKPAFQVIYERKRSHYVLVYYNARKKRIKLFDSLQRFKKNGHPKISEELKKQICHLFGHLFTEKIPIIVDEEYEKQTDDFSCGYRTIGALVDCVRSCNPSKYSYSRTAILEFLKKILDEPNPTWKMFESVKLGNKKEYDKDRRLGYKIKNSTYIPPTTSSGDSSSNSLASDGSKTSRKSVDSDYPSENSLARRASPTESLTQGIQKLLQFDD